ncbi:hypothetical protein C0989_010591 [Termitomyces sp. Mn162]|nr:hypothetical protein C0989_010591 [Termitomyces sp. Mn162]
MAEMFAQLMSLAKKITGYNAEDKAMGNPDMKRKDTEIDNKVSLAVVFDKDKQDNKEHEGFEICNNSDKEADNDEPNALPTANADNNNNNKKLHQITKIYPDPITATNKTTSVLSILSSESSLCDCKNQLIELFEYQSFHITTKFLKNHNVVVWCTKLMCSNADKCVNVEVAMHKKGLGWILHELTGNCQAKAAKSLDDNDAMDVDMKPKVPKTVMLQPGSTVEPKKMVNMMALAFSQGGHLINLSSSLFPLINNVIDSSCNI